MHVRNKVIMEILDKQGRKKVMAFALFVGEVMLKNGAETYRVEDSIRRICSSRDLQYITAFVTPTVIILGDDRNDGYTFMKRIDKRTTNFDRISLVNALSREFVEHKISIEDAYVELRSISTRSSYSEWVRILWCGLASSMFAYLFGGTFSDMVCGFVISIFATKIGFMLDRLDMNLFLLNATCSVLIAIFSVLAFRLHLGKNLDMIIAASIMPQLPGFSLTNGIRDFIAGDLISGASRAFEALLIAVAIAVSIGSVLSLFYRFGGLS